MSLFSILYAANPSTPEAAIDAAFPGHATHTEPDRCRAEADALEASARRRTRPNFDLELFGFEPAISIYFAIDKWRAPEARQQLAAAVRNFLSSIAGDVVVMYLDTIVLKRLGETAVCAIAYADMLPHGGAGWTTVPELEQPE